tara:strand:- start:3637 stop:4017 length:381 start_codon:yes stop_codon:yes gene_type:complete
MSWKDILKISTEEAISDARRFAPKDVEQGEKDVIERKNKRIQLEIEETLPKRRRVLSKFINLMKDNPTFAKSDIGAVVEYQIKEAKKHLMNPEIFARYIAAMRSTLNTVDEPRLFRDGTYTKEKDR